MITMDWAPFRQEGELWSSDPMWDYKKVVEVAEKYDGKTQSDVRNLIHKFDNGNNIGAEGCLLCCLAMVIKLLYQEEEIDPRILNNYARENIYYSASGMSMVPIYSDLVNDFTAGQVQLCTKEEYPYFTGSKRGFGRTFSNSSFLLRGYRSIPNPSRKNYVSMLKIGTYDDIFASHYLLVDPRDDGSINDDDLTVLDPYQPQGEKTWTLADACRELTKKNSSATREVAEKWKREGIKSKQIQGVWIFARWYANDQRMLMDALIGACAQDSLMGH